MAVILKRVYEAASKNDGYRVLIDRLWPRGLTKERAAVDLWLRDVAPSTELRKWFAHDEERWTRFQERYRSELRATPAPLAQLRKLARERARITLLYATQAPLHHGLVLKRLLGTPRHA